LSDEQAAKVAVVTGGASGLGRAVSIGFARRGTAVVVVDVDERGSAQTVREVLEQHGQARFARADVSSELQVARAVGQAEEWFGRLDYAVNCAAASGDSKLMLDQSLDVWDRVVATNLSGMFYCLRHEIAAILRTGTGAIVNVSSIAGLRGDVGMSPYSASKHGVNALSKVAALEYGAAGVRVNVLCPGGIRTSMALEYFERHPDKRARYEERNQRHPLRRGMAEPDEVAAAAIWLCSDEASYINGHELVVDGGISAAVLLGG
jgi:NAD(P)-dependent dehydrogenase (short-subunit alcohol dehydrogenase family)